MVYKLVARVGSAEPDAPMVSVEKRSPEKPSRGGQKYAYRRIDSDGVATAEVIGIASRRPTSPIAAGICSGR